MQELFKNILLDAQKSQSSKEKKTRLVLKKVHMREGENSYKYIPKRKGQFSSNIYKLESRNCR